MAAQEQRVLDFINRFPGRDDDEIAAALGISPRQTVNIICRRLVKRGEVRRDKASGRKIVNYPSGAPAARLKSIGAVIEPDAEGEIAPRSERPRLSTSQLREAGFICAGEWLLEADGTVRPDRELPKERGVYALCADGFAQYVGVASMGLKARLYFYSKPGVTQRTSQRINEILRSELSRDKVIQIYVATPDDLTWNGLPVNCGAGLEVGLIESFHLPWNIRGARPRSA